MKNSTFRGSRIQIMLSQISVYFIAKYQNVEPLVQSEEQNSALPRTNLIYFNLVGLRNLG